MSKKDKMVDSPGYDPDARVPFPPPAGGSSPFGQPQARKQPPAPSKKPYYETYTPDPPAPDPSQTDPNAPDIRDVDARLPKDADLDALSPKVELKE